MSSAVSHNNILFAAAQAIVITAFAFVYFLAPGRLLFVSPALIVVGDVLAVAGLVLMAAAVVSLRDVLEIAPAPREGGHLVTRGVYGKLRHPIYSGIVLIALGLFLREPGAWVAIAVAIIVALMIVKSRFEETLLLARYQEEYAEYRKRSWGVLPMV